MNFMKSLFFFGGGLHKTPEVCLTGDFMKSMSCLFGETS